MRFLVSSRALAIIALAAGAALRLLGLGHRQLWLDEIIQIQRFNHPAWAQCLADLRTETAPAPLDYLVQQLFLWILGSNEYGARLHAALAGILALPVVYLLAQEASRLVWALPSKTAAGPAGSGSASWRSYFPSLSLFLLAFYPLHIFYSREGRPYALFFLLALTSFWLLLRALRAQRGGQPGSPPVLYWTAYTLTLATALYTSFQALVLAALQIAWFAWLWMGNRREERKAATLSARKKSGRALPAQAPPRDGPALFSRRGLAAALASQCAALLIFAPWLLGTYSQTRGGFQESFLSISFVKRLIQESSGGSWPLSLLLLALAAWGLTRLLDRGDRLLASLLGIWLGLGLAAVLTLDALRGYFFAARQILFLAPAGLLAAALGWSFSSRLRRSLILLLLAASLGSGTVLLSKRKQQADWIGLAQTLRQEVRPGDRIAAPGLARALAFRYPQLPQQQITLDELLPQSRSLGEGRILMVRSRYLTADQERRTARVLELYSSQPLFEVRGFSVLVLEP